MNKNIKIRYNDIANWHGKLIYEMEKAFPDIDYSMINPEDIRDIDNKDLWKEFQMPIFTKIESNYDDNNELLEDDIKRVSYEMSEKLEANPEVFKEFVNDKIIEIFGNCEEVKKGVIVCLNRLTNEGYNITLTSPFKGKVRSAIFFFLSRHLYQGNVSFTDCGEEITMTELENLLK